MNNGGNGDQNELPIPIDWFEPEKVDDKSIEEILSENPDSYGIDDDILEKLGFKEPPAAIDYDTMDIGPVPFDNESEDYEK